MGRISLREFRKHSTCAGQHPWDGADNRIARLAPASENTFDDFSASILIYKGCQLKFATTAETSELLCECFLHGDLFYWRPRSVPKRCRWLVAHAKGRVRRSRIRLWTTANATCSPVPEQ